VIKVGICGGSGYTGSELLRILSLHPSVQITVITSERSAGISVEEYFPHLKGATDLVFERLNPSLIARKADLFFLALPHGASQESVAAFFNEGKKVVDLSADYRLKDHNVYSEWYGTEHRFRAVLKRAVYGLPEINRRRIKRARLVANPGCYPTGALLGLYPLIRKGVVDLSNIVIDSKSGTSGAGRKADTALSFCEVNESFRAYGIAVHRHTPEIEQGIQSVTGESVTVNFTPHLLPVNRGILTTIYGKLRKDLKTSELISLFRRTYAKEPFIRVYEEGRYPDVKNVRGTNFCDIGVCVNRRTSTVVVVTAIDNLMKGASSQAVQNMNLMLGLDETEGLSGFAPLP
jgi:N-acetyl-gamma-glutamyl-phosphate reductase